MRTLQVHITCVTVQEVEVPDCFEPDKEKLARFMPEFIEWAELDVPAEWLPMAITVHEQDAEVDL